MSLKPLGLRACRAIGLNIGGVHAWFRLAGKVTLTRMQSVRRGELGVIECKTVSSVDSLQESLDHDAVCSPVAITQQRNGPGRAWRTIDLIFVS
jgi:hypothetical protein